MCVRCFNWCIAALLAVGILAGCKKAVPENTANQGAGTNAPVQKLAPIPETVARLHWLGTRGILAGTNAASFKKISDLPETAKLASQTLDKLSLGLVRGYPAASTNLVVWVTNYPALLATNQAATSLRPLLQDLLEQETFFEVRHVTNQPGELVLAVRLDESRASSWSTNLASAIETLSGIHPVPAQSNTLSWHCVITNSPWSRSAGPQHLELARAGDWTLLGLASNENLLLKELSARIQADSGGSPVPARETNYWIETTANLAGLSTALGLDWSLPAEFPMLWLAAIGRGEDVLTLGRFTFDKPFVEELPAWIIPTNLINDPLHSFTAVRGIGPWLSAQTFWRDLQVGEAPNQFFTWAQSGTPFLGYFAAPMPDASNAVTRVGERIMQLGNPILADNRMGVIERSTNFHGFTWNRVPIVKPFLRSDTASGEFLFGGLFIDRITNTPPLSLALSQLLSETNLVAYQSEITGPRLEALMYLGQLSRFAFRRQQLPGDSLFFSFFKAVLPVAGSTRTMVSKSGPGEFSLRRSSGTGLTAAEWHLVADWLESPFFPSQLHSAVVKLPALPGGRSVTNDTIAPNR